MGFKHKANKMFFVEKTLYLLAQTVAMQRTTSGSPYVFFPSLLLIESSLRNINVKSAAFDVLTILASNKHKQTEAVREYFVSVTLKTPTSYAPGTPTSMATVKAKAKA